MKLKLFHLGCCFVFMWTLGQIFQASDMQNLSYSLSMTLAYFIYIGVHEDLINYIKRHFNKI